jgi:hypothetical protein
MFFEMGKAYTGSIDKQRLHINTFTLEQRDKLDEIWSRLILAIAAGDERSVTLLMYIVESTVIQYTLLDANKRKAEFEAKVAERGWQHIHPFTFGEPDHDTDTKR